MKISIVSVGKKHDSGMAEAILEYTKRSSHFISVQWKLLDNKEKVEDEGRSILNTIHESDYVVLLDETGKMLKSEELASLIGQRMNESIKQMVFVIGGAYGVSKEVKDRANYILSLSKLVFPHQIVRLVIAEQIYRALTILNNGKYHHA